MGRLRWLQIIFLLHLNVVFGKKACNNTDLNNVQCSASETCIPLPQNVQGAYCECLPGFLRINETFCKNMTKEVNSPSPRSSSLTDEGSNGHIVAGILIPVLIIMVVIFGLYFSRNKLMAWMRNKINQRNNNYDEVMIGQDLDDDDSPIH